MRHNKWHSDSRPVISWPSVILSVRHVLCYWSGLFVSVRPPRENGASVASARSSFNTSPLIQHNILSQWENTGWYKTNPSLCVCLSPGKGILIETLMTQLYTPSWPWTRHVAIVSFFHTWRIPVKYHVIYPKSLKSRINEINLLRAATLRAFEGSSDMVLHDHNPNTE